MLIHPHALRLSYNDNHSLEKEMGRILGLFDVKVTDILNAMRVEYDWLSNGKMTEHKTTSSYDLPIELYKDEAQTIPSGFLTTHALVTTYLSRGGRQNSPVGKLRVFLTKDLLEATNGRKGTFFQGKTRSQDAYVVYVPCGKDNCPPHIWLGDMPCNDDGAYYTDAFRPNLRAKDDLLALLDGLER